jgi:hypothetical protein
MAVEPVDDPFAPLSKRDELMRKVATVDAAELERMIDTLMGLMVLMDFEFHRRFPTEYAAWEQKHE